MAILRAVLHREAMAALLADSGILLADLGRLSCSPFERAPDSATCDGTTVLERAAELRRSKKAKRQR